MPPDAGPGGGSKVLLHKSESNGHLVYDGIVVSAGLIVHAPTSVDELQLVRLCHQLLHLMAREREVGKDEGRERRRREGEREEGGREGGGRERGRKGGRKGEVVVGGRR